MEINLSDYRKALEEQMDGVFICTPDHLHVKMAIDALEIAEAVIKFCKEKKLICL